jgi:CRISPR/Cas system-associated exonuclease Cas4 (RecB family)
MDEDYKNELRQFEDPTARLLVEYFADKNIADTGPGFETPFGSAIIKGTADLLITSNDGICIVEFKEHDYRESNNKFDFLPYLQLLFYYFGLISRNVHINRGWYGFFCNGTVDEVIFTQQMINDAKNYLEQIFQELIECQVFESRPNILCGTCGYRSKCTRKTEGSKV